MYIINAKIFTVDGNFNIVNSGYIKISGNKITDIGEMCNYHQIEKSLDEKVIDATGYQIYPGFIDAHTHLGMWEDSLGFEGSDGNEATDPILPQLQAIDAINPMDKCFREALESGVTSVVTGPGSANPISGQMAMIKTSGEKIDDMIIKAPIAMKMSLGENPKSTYDEKGQAPSTRMSIAALIREELIKTQRYIEDINYAKQQESYIENRPDFDYKLESLIPVVNGQLPVHFHAHRADDMFTAIRIAREFNLNFSIVHATEAASILKHLKDSKISLLMGPLISDRSKPELRKLDPSTVSLADNYGIPVAITTDHPVVPVQYLCLSAALAVRENLSPKSAIRAITINPAKICKVSDRLGSIEIGKDADLVFFKTDPLLISSKASLVIVNGKICYNNAESDFNIE